MASDLAEVAETIRNDAFTLAYQALPVAQRDGDVQRLLNEPAFFSRFKYRLCAAVARVLAANDPRVSAVYTFDPCANADDELGVELAPDATLHLLVLVSTPTAALESFVDSLDRALTMSLKYLPSPTFALRDSVLDVNLVTEEEVQLGVGWAALLRSVFAPAIEIWMREP